MATDTGFLHMVFFWLREDGDVNDAHLLADGCNTYLKAIPGILSIQIGYPAGTDRDVVDNSYGVALVVGFADKAAHDLYQDHPDHLRFIAQCRHLWRKVQVYDLKIPPLHQA